MRQEDYSTLWDAQQKMLDGRMWSVCNVGAQVCSVEQTEGAAVTSCGGLRVAYRRVYDSRHSRAAERSRRI